MQLWPTRVKTYEWDNALFDKELVALVMARHHRQLLGPRLGPDDRHRVYGIFEEPSPIIHELKDRVAFAVNDYLGPEANGTHTGFDIDGRAVVMLDGDHIATHVERREADLTIAYWPTGDAKNKPVSCVSNPQFVISDPSRYLTDLRLPDEGRHSVYIAPRPGLMLVMPNHIPHHQQPYFGDTPHVQIVCNVKIKFTEAYFRNRW